MVNRNVFTNPRLEGSGTWVETARNHFIQPILDSYDINVIESWAGSSNTQQFSTSAAPWAKSGHAFTVEYTTVVTTTNGDVGPRPVIEAPRVFIPLQQEWTIAYTVMTNTAGTISAPNHPGVVRSATSGDFEAEPGTPYRIWSTFQRNVSEPFPTNTRISIVHRGKQDGTTLSIADVDLYPGAYQPNREFFVPNAPSPDPDMRVRFVGAENASASVLEGEIVEGFIPESVAVIVSQRNGTPAGRFIKVQDVSQGTTIFLSPPVGEFTALATFDWEGHLSVAAGVALVGEETLALDYVTEPGGVARATLESVTMGALVEPAGVQLTGWLTSFGLYEGTYNGPPADGDTPGWAWEGEPGNSPSRQLELPSPNTRRKMYFGTKEYMTWVPCPAVERDSSAIGWSESVTLLNGGNVTKRSKGSHRAYEMAWNLVSREEAGVLEAFASGAYGDGPFYWVDPMAANVNVLPQQWANPQETILLPHVESLTVSRVPAPAQNGYPATELYLTGLPLDVQVARLWIPIPRGYTAHIGVHSSHGTPMVTAQPDGGVEQFIPNLPRTTTQRTNFQVHGEMAPGVTLAVRTATGTVRLGGLIVQILPSNRTVDPGGWLNGLGNSGCEFEEFPERTDYSSVFDKVGLTATMKEVGSWAQ